jgi:hypothetical protein
MWRLEAHPVGLGLLAAVAGLTLLFVALGPAATATLPVPLAAAYWLLHIGAGIALCVASTRLLQRFAPIAGHSGWLLLAAAAVLASMLFAPFAVQLDRAFPTPADVPEGLLDQWELAGGALQLIAEWLQLAPEFVVAWLLLNAPPLVSLRLAAVSSPPVVDTAGPGRSPEIPSPSWLDRLPPAIGRELVSISADLHYLHVRTTRGKATLLGSLDDAERSLGEDVLRIHRSHLAAVSQVRRLLRKGSAWLLETATGDKLPVSRRRVAAVRARLGKDFVVADP